MENENYLFSGEGIAGAQKELLRAYLSRVIELYSELEENKIPPFLEGLARIVQSLADGNMKNSIDQRFDPYQALEVRENAGCTQRDVAEQASVTQAYVCFAEPVKPKGEKFERYFAWLVEHGYKD